MPSDYFSEQTVPVAIDVFCMTLEALPKDSPRAREIQDAWAYLLWRLDKQTGIDHKNAYTSRTGNLDSSPKLVRQMDRDLTARAQEHGWRTGNDPPAQSEASTGWTPIEAVAEQMSA
jgi:hypothetical protein